MFGLSEDEIERYSRNIALPEVGEEGQKRLKAARVLVVGAGGLGSPASLYLAAAGVGQIGIVDSDVIELSNLQRQILHHTGDLDRPKTESAAETISALNPEVDVRCYQMRLNKDNVVDIVSSYDIVVDGVDNFPARYLLNDACVMHSKPLVDAGVLRFLGQIMTILPHQGPCYRCLFASPPPPGAIPSCQEAGILGAVAGLLGVLEAVEAIKYILGTGQLLVGRILIIEALSLTFREVVVKRNPQCPVCGDSPTITELIDYDLVCEA